MTRRLAFRASVTAAHDTQGQFRIDGVPEVPHHTVSWRVSGPTEFVNPGEVLRDELEALGLSANAVSKALDVPVNRITAILHGQRGVTADTALRLARYFGTTTQVWMNLQKTYELRRAEIKAGHQIAERVRPRQTAA